MGYPHAFLCVPLFGKQKKIQKDNRLCYNRPSMKIKLIWLIVLSFTALSGCMTSGTKDLPVSKPDQAIIGTPNTFQGKNIGVYVLYHDAKVEGGHHEGLMQVKQPWIFGMSKEQKEILYGNAGEFAANAFISELARQNLNIALLRDWNEKLFKKYDYVITATIEKIIINTFGRGTMEGFGSAGDYWEAKVLFSNVKMEDPETGEIFFDENMETYAKLKPCPVKLDWTFLTIVNKSLQNSSLMEEIADARTAAKAVSKGKAYVKNWEASYHIEGYRITPMEVAARKAACKLIMNCK